MRRVLNGPRRRGGRLRKPLKSFEGINITPFTDVLLVLLIVFMIAGSALAPTGLGVTGLAAAEVGGPAAGKPVLSVEIDADGVTRLRYEGELLNWDELAKLSHSTPVTLRIEPDTPAERIVRQYDRLLDAGLQEIEWAPPATPP